MARNSKKTTKSASVAETAEQTIAPAQTDETKLEAPKAETPVETDEAMLARLQRENETRWANVTAIVERGKNVPKRVLLNCDDPRTKQGPD
jgi:hypothetical protein